MTTITAVYGPRSVLCSCVRPALSDHGVADFGAPDRTSHISKTVLPIVKFGGLTLNEVKRLRSLEDENRRLKQIVAQQALNNWALRELLAKNF